MSVVDHNPFRFGAVVEGDYYVDRPEIEKRVVKALKDTQNIFLVGERRCGKTSLVLNVLKKKYGKKIFHVDLYGVDSAHELTHRFVKAFAQLQSQFFTLEDTIRAVARFRVRAEVKSDGSGIDFQPTIEEKAPLRDLSAVLISLRDFSEKTSFGIFIDEFQEIQKLKEHRKIKGEMRAQIQLFQKASFIYAGSIRHQMDFIFRSPEDPFYKSALPIEFEKIPVENFYPFVLKKLAKKKIKISEAIFRQIYNELDGISGDIQQYFQFVYDLLGEGSVLGEPEKRQIYAQVFHSEEKFYHYILNESGLTELQRRVLTEVACSESSGVTAKRFKESVGNSNNNAIVKALKRLEDLNHLFKSGGRYYFFNPYFRMWIQTHREK